MLVSTPKPMDVLKALEDVNSLVIVYVPESGGSVRKEGAVRVNVGAKLEQALRSRAAPASAGQVRGRREGGE
jgi:hypothetical protein